MNQLNALSNRVEYFEQMHQFRCMLKLGLRRRPANTPENKGLSTPRNYGGWYDHSMPRWRGFLQWLFASVLFGMLVAIFAGIIGEFFIELGKEKGWYANPSQRLEAVMTAFSDFVTNRWFLCTTAFAAGLTVGAWIDFLLPAGSSLKIQRLLLKGETNLIQAQKEQKETLRRPLTSQVPIVEIEFGIGRLSLASPWFEFYCLGYNATGCTVRLISAEGRIRIGPNVFHAPIELGGKETLRTDEFFRFTIALPVTATEAQLIPRERTGHLVVQFVDAKVFAIADTMPANSPFEIRLPQQVQFVQHTRRSQPALAEQIMRQ